MTKEPSRPNIIVFLTDQQRWDTAGAYGNPLGLTPAFDSIASRGTFFQHAFTPQPLCAPARAALQTGQYPTTVGCFRNGRPLPENSPTIARAFAEAGYQTAYIGKWHLASQEPVPTHEQAGYQYWLGANAIEWTSHPYDTTVYDRDGAAKWLPGYRTDGLVDAAIRYIAHAAQDASNAPFFLFFSLLEPHHQNDIDRYVCPTGYERYGKGWCPPDLEKLVGSSRLQLPGYLGMVKRIDEGLMRLLDALQSLKILDSSVVAYATDHGCHFRTRNAEYKRSCHESSIRIPMAIQGPYFDDRGTVNSLATLLDLPTMLCDSAGIDMGPAAVGGHLGDHDRKNRQNSIIRTSETDGNEEESILIQLSEAGIGRALRTRRWKYCVTAEAPDGEVDGCAHDYWESHLYDLENDPWELTNLVASPSLAEIRNKLRSQLEGKMIDIGESSFDIHRGQEGRW